MTNMTKQSTSWWFLNMFPTFQLVQTTTLILAVLGSMLQHCSKGPLGRGCWYLVNWVAFTLCRCHDSTPLCASLIVFFHSKKYIFNIKIRTLHFKKREHIIGEFNNYVFFFLHINGNPGWYQNMWVQNCTHIFVILKIIQYWFKTSLKLVRLDILWAASRKTPAVKGRQPLSGSYLIQASSCLISSLLFMVAGPSVAQDKEYLIR